MKNVFYIGIVAPIGGIETWIYNIVQMYGDDFDINVFYLSGDEKQIERLRNKAHVYKYIPGVKIKCDRLFCCHDLSILKDVEAKEIYQFEHCDFYTLRDKYPKPNLDDRITGYLAVSNVVKEGFKKVTGIDAEVVYNPIYLQENNVLRLVSATRLTLEKGKDRIIKMANELVRNNIPFIWDIYTNDKNVINIKGVRYKEPMLDVANEYKNYHYLVQLSDSEGFCMSVLEALKQSVPVIITKIPLVDEIGCDESNSFVLDFDLNNLDVNKIYEKRNKFNFKFEEPKSDFKNILIGGSREVSKIKVKVIKQFYDIECGVNRKVGDEFEVEEVRYEYLKDHKAVEFISKVLETIKTDEQFKEIKEEEEKELNAFKPNKKAVKAKEKKGAK